MGDEHAGRRLQGVGPQVVEGCEAEPVVLGMPAYEAGRDIVLGVRLDHHQFASVPTFGIEKSSVVDSFLSFSDRYLFELRATNIKYS